MAQYFALPLVCIAADEAPQFAARCVQLVRGFRLRRNRRPYALQVVSVPIEIALIAVLDEGWPREFVEFAGIYDEQRGHTKTPQALIHLFAVDYRHISIHIASHDEGWRGDLGYAAEGR